MGQCGRHRPHATHVVEVGIGRVGRARASSARDDALASDEPHPLGHLGSQLRGVARQNQPRRDRSRAHLPSTPDRWFDRGASRAVTYRAAMTEGEGPGRSAGSDGSREADDGLLTYGSYLQSPSCSRCSSSAPTRRRTTSCCSSSCTRRTSCGSSSAVRAGDGRATGSSPATPSARGTPGARARDRARVDRAHRRDRDDDPAGLPGVPRRCSRRRAGSSPRSSARSSSCAGSRTRASSRTSRRSPGARTAAAPTGRAHAVGRVLRADGGRGPADAAGRRARRDEPRSSRWRATTGPVRGERGLLDHDEAVARWRYHHVLMVEREIGAKRGTGGAAAWVTCVRRSTSGSSPNCGACAAACRRSGITPRRMDVIEAAARRRRRRRSPSR